MSRNDKGAGLETGAPGNVLAGDCLGLLTVFDHRAQRLASRYRVRPALAETVAELAWCEVPR